MSALEIRLARADDREKLIELQRRASLAGNDDKVRHLLRERPELIDLAAEMIAGNQVFVAHRGGHLVGFATIVTHEGDDAELEGLFVEPAEWRKGVGTLLVRAILREATAWGANRLHVTANAEAVPFYRAQGFAVIGERASELGPMALLMARPVAPGGSGGEA